MVSRGRSDRGKKRIPFLLRGLFVPISTSVGPPPRAPKSFSLLQRAECTTAGEYTRFAPAHWQPLFRYSPLDLQFRPSTHEIPAFPRNPRYFSLFDLLSIPSPLVFASSSSSYSSAASPSSSSHEHVQGFLKTYHRRQPDRASFLPFCWPSRTSAGRPLPPPHRSPTACPFLPSLPIFLIHAHHHGLSSMESNVSSVYRSPGHAPFFSILRSFQSFTVFSPCCFPPPGLFG